MSTTILLLAGVLVSLVGLSLAADAFVKNSSLIAKALRVSPLVVGVVLMGFGTSLPELAVSVQSALGGSGDLALGNIVGSNVVNMTIVLGIGAMISVMFVSGGVVRREAAYGTVATLLYGAGIIALGTFGGIGPRLLVGLVLVGFGGIAVMVQLRSARSDRATADEFVVEVASEMAELHNGSRSSLIAKCVVSLVLLVAAAQLLVFSATGLATEIGLSEVVVGVLLLALGTSLPELASTIAAARKREHDLVVGNLWGSTLFNASFVGGAALLAGPAPTVALWVVAVPAAIALLAWAITATNLRIVRWEGAVLVSVGMAATAALVLVQ